MAGNGKLSFMIQDLPDGKASKDVSLGLGELDLGENSLLEARVEFNFHKTQWFVDVSFSVNAVVKRQCQRSLKWFETSVESSYHVTYSSEFTHEEIDYSGGKKPFPNPDDPVTLDAEVRDSIVLELPIRPLHPDFIDENGQIKPFSTQTFGDTELETSVDPRWQALKHLK
ncbi:MAG TPA: hypothetical protein DEF03_01175 [Bacteroidetes bacterium]|nr:MAG: DUF177 domain-containing protein [Rhodothermaeota bacterium MED-G64]HBV99785.1 hypothetical protein [Bacteroidota bacterium]|tara:strand:+ start:8133 stop:8642 length:510 start_codon:yes stop_codon:yes gene_type:complete